MIKKSIKLLLVLVVVSLLMSFGLSDSTSVKCMIQLKNYKGEGAYIVVSVLDVEDNYIKTLRILGDDEEWYPDLEEWYPNYEANNSMVDGITGATIKGGERSIFSLAIDAELIDKGNILRFETAVEDQKYIIDDVRIPLNRESLKGKYQGSEYIRYVKLLSR
ncbi:MAG: DUF2271 domain-containing protein [Bacteroidota bacterium]